MPKIPVLWSPGQEWTFEANLGYTAISYLKEQNKNQMVQKAEFILMDKDEVCLLKGFNTCVLITQLQGQTQHKLKRNMNREDYF